MRLPPSLTGRTWRFERIRVSRAEQEGGAPPAYMSSMQPVNEFIFESAPFPSCHASTVVELADGRVMAAWFGGSTEGEPDVAVWGATRSDGVWSPPRQLAREPHIACYNPVLFHTADGALQLYYKFGRGADRWTAGRRSSRDDGTTWSRQEHLPAGLYGPIRAKPLVRPDGAIVSGTSVESYRSWACWIERSTDNGATWERSGPITVARPETATEAAGDAPPEVPGSDEWALTEGIIQPSVVSMGGDRLRLYARSTAKTGKVCVAESEDGGARWTQARPIDLPNPNSGIDAVALSDGRIVVIYNHTDCARTPLNLAVSADGDHFHMFHVLEDAPGEYSYPAMVVAANGDLLITYTYNRKTIRYVRYPNALLPPAG